MIGSLQSNKQLEALVKQASEAISKTKTENRGLKERLARAESELKRLREELREAKMTLARHDRIKARLVKLSEKLEKIA
jgi:septal ring factor EnvC (AmiA/AmiB activator)